MGLLNSADKEHIKRALPKSSNKIIDVAIARLYIAYPNPNEWQYTGLSGAIVLVDDLVGHTFFLKLVDIKGHRGVLWDHELYVNFDYYQDRTFFHSFEIEGCYAGLLFEDLNEAAHFLKRVHKREKYASKKTLSNKNAIALTKKVNEERANTVVNGPRGESLYGNQRERYNYDHAESIPVTKHKAPPPPPPVAPAVASESSDDEYVEDTVSDWNSSAPTTPAPPTPAPETPSAAPSSSQPKAKHFVPPPPPASLVPPAPTPASAPAQNAPAVPSASAPQAAQSPQSPTLPHRSNNPFPFPVPEPTANQQLNPFPFPVPQQTPSMSPSPQNTPFPIPGGNIQPQPTSANRPVPALPNRNNRPLPTPPARQGRNPPPVPPSRHGAPPPPPPHRNLTPQMTNNYTPAALSAHATGAGRAPVPPPPRRGPAPPPPPRAARHQQFTQPQAVPPLQTTFPTQSPAPPPTPPTTFNSGSAQSFAPTPSSLPSQNVASTLPPPPPPMPTQNSVAAPPPPPPMPTQPSALPPRTSAAPPPAPPMPTQNSAAPPPPPAFLTQPQAPQAPHATQPAQAPSQSNFVESTGDAGRDALLASIRGAGGVGALRKVDKSQLDRPSVLLQEAHGQPAAPAASSSGPPPPGGGSLADALAAALNQRKAKVGSDDYDNGDDW